MEVLFNIGNGGGGGKSLKKVKRTMGGGGGKKEGEGATITPGEEASPFT